MGLVKGILLGKYANAYTGAAGVIAALHTGARVVITGRTSDANGLDAEVLHPPLWGGGFHGGAFGDYLLLPYNMIRKEVATPIPCHGYSLFDDGTLVAFREMSAEPARVDSQRRPGRRDPISWCVRPSNPPPSCRPSWSLS